MPAKSLGRTEHFHVTLTKLEKETIKQYSKITGISCAQIVGQYIRDHLLPIVKKQTSQGENID